MTSLTICVINHHASGKKREILSKLNKQVTITFDADICFQCGLCVSKCPTKAITV